MCGDYHFVAPEPVTKDGPASATSMVPVVFGMLFVSSIFIASSHVGEATSDFPAWAGALMGIAAILLLLIIIVCIVLCTICCPCCTCCPCNRKRSVYAIMSRRGCSLNRNFYYCSITYVQCTNIFCLGGNSPKCKPAHNHVE